jgi:putative component of membrane protein insertase Oxa1/YidC/SpoIIIJ protein YidD
MLGHLALAAIGGYQRFASPHKCFRCAYHVLHGRGSCSDVALYLTRRCGALRMFCLMPLQAARCRRAFEALSQSQERERGAKEKGKAGVNASFGRQCLSDLANSSVACCPWP